MDINFKCSRCAQELTVDDTAAGTPITCPSCDQPIVVPAAPPHPHGHSIAHAHPAHVINPISQSAAAKEEKHFSVPVHEHPSEVLISKPLPPLDTAGSHGVHLRIKTIRRTDCVEVGKDHFDEILTKFLEKVGEPNVVSIHTFNYTHQDLATRDWVTDFGVMIVYRM